MFIKYGMRGSASVTPGVAYDDMTMGVALVLFACAQRSSIIPMLLYEDNAVNPLTRGLRLRL